MHESTAYHSIILVYSRHSAGDAAADISSQSNQFALSLRIQWKHFNYLDCWVGCCFRFWYPRYQYFQIILFQTMTREGTKTKKVCVKSRRNERFRTRADSCQNFSTQLRKYAKLHKIYYIYIFLSTKPIIVYLFKKNRYMNMHHCSAGKTCCEWNKRFRTPTDTESNVPGVDERSGVAPWTLTSTT